MKINQKPKTEMPASVRRSEYDTAIDYIVMFSDKENCAEIDTELDENSVPAFIIGLRSRGYTRKLKFKITRDDKRPSVIWACLKED